MKRLEEIASYAAKKSVRLMIDAEQSYFQDAIDLLVKDLQLRYNVNFPAIYNTYQCYLRNSFFRVESDLKLAKKQGWIFAAKIVRGAYIVQVRICSFWFCLSLYLSGTGVGGGTGKTKPRLGYSFRDFCII